MQALPLEREHRPPHLVSVAQFRPEKAHLLQLRALALARKGAAGQSAPGGLISSFHAGC